MANLPAIILCRPQNTGNIGSISRAMTNFGFTQLFLVDPPEGWREDDSTLNMSNGYTECLDKAIVVEGLSELNSRFGGLIGFTRRAGSHRPIIGELHDAVVQVCEMGAPEKIGLVFGNERTGLRAEELDCCDSLYTIASVKKDGSLNLAMAAGVVMYKLAHQADAIYPHADGSDVKPLPIISIDEVKQRTNEILDNLHITKVFKP
jgi:TrmH family RNA methyltransferase